MRNYSVWDVEANNLLGHYMTEREALRSVKDLLDTFGREYVDELALGGRDEHDRPIKPIGGTALAKRALKVDEAKTPSVVVQSFGFRSFRSTKRTVGSLFGSHRRSGRSDQQRADALRNKVLNKRKDINVGSGKK